MQREHHAIFAPFDGVSALTRVLKSRCSPRRKVALLYVLMGLSYRKAEAATGGQDDVALFRNAERMRIQRIHNQRKQERESWLCTPHETAAIDATIQGTANPKQALMAAEKALWAAETIAKGMRI
ncbi:MAG: hypothetical protein JRE70_15785 [Deltaproteobacteria bacterium]|nr:hypothetical protein [Deltaproteobacteria bacterium]